MLANWQMSPIQLFRSFLIFSSIFSFAFLPDVAASEPIVESCQKILVSIEERVQSLEYPDPMRLWVKFNKHFIELEAGEANAQKEHLRAILSSTDPQFLETFHWMLAHIQKRIASIESRTSAQEDVRQKGLKSGRLIIVENSYEKTILEACRKMETHLKFSIESKFISYRNFLNTSLVFPSLLSGLTKFDAFLNTSPLTVDAHADQGLENFRQQIAGTFKGEKDVFLPLYLPFPTIRDLSTQDFESMHGMPVYPLGLSFKEKIVDGAIMRPDRFLEHDWQHAREKHRLDTGLLIRLRQNKPYNRASLRKLMSFYRAVFQRLQLTQEYLSAIDSLPEDSDLKNAVRTLWFFVFHEWIDGPYSKAHIQDYIDTWFNEKHWWERFSSRYGAGDMPKAKQVYTKAFLWLQNFSNQKE